MCWQAEVRRESWLSLPDRGNAMTKSNAPATVLICAALPQTDRSGTPAGRLSAVPVSPAIPVTWIGSVEAVVRGGFAPDRSDLAIELEPEWFTSRQALRSAIARARGAVPGIEAAVLRRAPLEHRELLAEAGIRVVLVDAFADTDRGSRRPAPQGWPCRNVAWGLWEVDSARRQPTGLRAWLPRFTSLPVAWPGGLHVLVDRTVVPGSRGAMSPRVERWIEWAQARQTRGAVMAATLADLPTIVERRQRQPFGGSVLRAA
jgi:hypothetical protein